VKEGQNLQVLVKGLRFPEGPRWHDGRLWFSDFYQRAVFSIDLDGNLSKALEVPNSPSGLGWLPDGSLLVVSMADQLLLRFAHGALTEVATLTHLATGPCNPGDHLVLSAGFFADARPRATAAPQLYEGTARIGM